MCFFLIESAQQEKQDAIYITGTVVFHMHDMLAYSVMW